MTDAANVSSRHVMAVIGGATAGSEIARILAGRGALVIVFEQNPRPYGKIEDGLPRWHVKQRHDEYEEINKRLDHPNIEYVPLTRMGRDIDFEELRDPLGTQRNRADQRRVARPPVSGRRRRSVHRSRAGLSEQADLLVQSLSGKDLRRPALRADVRARSSSAAGSRRSTWSKSCRSRRRWRGSRARGIEGEMLEARARRDRAGAEAKGLKYADSASRRAGCTIADA